MALILVVLVVLVPLTYVLAVSNNSAYGMMDGIMDDTDTNDMMNNGESIEDKGWWDEMQEFMEDHEEETGETTELGTKDEDFEDWWDKIADFMEDHFEELDDEEWFDQMKAYMEDHMGDIEDKNWFDEMEDHMEEHWEEYEEDDDNHSHGCH